MPLRVVTGRANAGKTGWIRRWAFEALSAGQSPILVVPNLADVRRLQMELAGKAPLGVHVATMQSFTEELWQLYGDGRRLVGDATRAAIMRQILERSAVTFGIPSLMSPGFERLMLRAAQASRWKPLSEGHPSEESARYAAEILERYRDALGDLDLIEQSWIGGLLARDIPAIGFLGALRFTTYTNAELELLGSLSARATVCVALTWEEGFAPTAANDGAARALIERADVVQNAVEPPESSELDALVTRMCAGPSSLRPSGTVVLGEARGAAGEAALVCSLARAAVDEGVAPERIAIVFPRLDDRLGIMRTALAAEELEGDYDCSVTVAATSFGRSFAALVRLGIGTGGRADALEFLQGPFSDADPAKVLHADHAWRKNRQGDDSKSILADLAKLDGCAEHLARLARARIDDDTAKQWQNLADRMISAAALKSPRGLSREEAGAHRAITAAVAQMATAPGTPFGAVDILEALPWLTSTSGGEESSSRVQVVQASRVGARRFDIVILGGLTQAEMPGRSRESFASELTAHIAGRSSADEGPRATLEFYSLLSRARSRLFLVRQTESSEGASQLASPLLEEVIDVYREPGSSTGESNASDLLDVVKMTDVVASAPVFTQGRRNERLLPVHAIPAARVVSHGQLDPDLAAEAVVDRVFTATEIESYLACPYSWFYSRLLRPRDVDTELDAAALGSRAHRLIAKFYEALKSDGVDRVTPDTLPAALSLFDRVAQTVEKGMEAPLNLGEEIDVARARLWARRVVEDDALLLPESMPLGHEVEFGDDGEFAFADVPISGRIDRIDVGPGGIVVTDYKSTRDVGKLVRPGPGFGIQHVVYAAAAEKIADAPARAAVYRSLRTRRMRGFWRSSQAGSLPAAASAGDVVDEGQYEEILSLAQDMVSGAVEGMRAGRIPRSPRTQTQCTYCTLGPICEGART